MKNELGRKITSLTIMAIMVAGGLTLAAPGMMPEAEAQSQHLYVSAVNDESGNTFGGPQVIEIIISDPARTSLELSGSTTGPAIGGVPDVEVNGDNVAMVQAIDGNWYGYIGDDGNITDADGLGADYGLNYGIECTTSALAVIGIGIDEGGLGDIASAFVSDAACSAGQANADADILRGAPALFPSSGATDYQGGNQIEDDQASAWPFIQTYVLDKYDDFDICYVNGSASECVTVHYDDSSAYAGVTADRTLYPPGAQVELDIFDNMLNIDPTAVDIWTFDFSANTPSYGEFTDGSATASDNTDLSSINLTTLGFDDNAVFKMTENSVLDVQDNGDFTSQDTSTDISFIESSWNTGHFINVDDDDKTNLFVLAAASRGTSGTIDYNDSAQSILVGLSTASLVFDTDAVGEEWNSGEELPLTLTEADLNLNNSSNEDLTIIGDYARVPTLTVGSPGYLAHTATASISIGETATGTGNSTDLTTNAQSHIATVSSVVDGGTIAEGVEIYTGYPASDFEALMLTIDADGDDYVSDETRGAILMGYDLRQVAVDVCGSNLATSTSYDVWFDGINIGVRDADSATLSAVQENQAQNGEIDLTSLITGTASSTDDGYMVVEMHCRTAHGTSDSTIATAVYFYVDFYSFASGVNNAIYRIQAEESGDGTGMFEGSVEYKMLNQGTADQYSDFPSRTHTSDAVVMLMTGDAAGASAPRVQISDTDSDGVSTPQAVQADALTHSATVAFDTDSYKIADTVTVTVNDQDLNTDSSLLEIYTIKSSTSTASDNTWDKVTDSDAVDVAAGNAFSHYLEITFDDVAWQDFDGSSTDYGAAYCGAAGFNSTGFTLVETDVASGTFVGTFQIPSVYCESNLTTAADAGVTTTGTDMEVNYIDFYDAASNTIEVGAGAVVVANTGSITLDRDVYPVPFDASVTTVANYAFLDYSAGAQSTHTGSDDGDVTVYAWIADVDFDQSPNGEDKIATTAGNSSIADDSGAGTCGECGPVVIKIYRGSDYAILNSAGASAAATGLAQHVDADDTGSQTLAELGPIVETDDDTGVFELSFALGHDSGPYVDGSQQVIKQGDVLTVEYTDPTDASGDSSYLATDSATFDLRTGVLTTDKSVYVIGQDIIISIIDDDLNLDSDSTESYGLDLVDWNSDAGEVLLDTSYPTSFDPEPSAFRETGSDTGVFQSVIEFPSAIYSSATANTVIDRGEVVDLEYIDYGPSGADYYNDDTEDVGATISSSNFGATIELDQKVYTWTERVFITITAPDHNMDTANVDEIGNTTNDPITVATRDTKRTTYKLLETGPDTGIFYGEVTLGGFKHDADGDTTTGDANGKDKSCTAASGSGPTGGVLCAQDEDGITVSFEYTEDSTVIGSALIRWNIGEAQWLDSSYSAGASGVVRVSDPDMDWNADYVDNFKVDVWSDSDSGGIDLTVTETSEMSGVFEGTVFFTTTDESSGHRLRVSEGDTVTVEYDDNTLPNPYNPADELEVSGTAIIGTITPPLERAPAANARVVDAFGNSLSEVSVDQQVQIEADLVNGTGTDQSFAYLVQVQNESGVTVSLAWITGSLSAGQSFSPALSWIPSASGSYEATVFVWESVDNPSALSDTVSVSIDVV